MDERFQDRIDNYLLNRMDDAEKTEFLREVEQDIDKKEQLEFTRNVKDSIRSREEKLRALTQFQRQYEVEREATAMRATGTDAVFHCSAPKKMGEKTLQSKKTMWLWISGIAAMFVVGFFSVRHMFIDGPVQGGREKEELIRGDDKLFERPVPADTTAKDTTLLQVEKEEIPHE